MPWSRLDVEAIAETADPLAEEAMNTDVLKGMWHQLKGEAKVQWGKLTDDDLDRVDGDAEKLIGRVQERYGYARADAEREVSDFLSRHPMR